MPHVLSRVTIAEISADQNVCKIVYENNFNLLKRRLHRGVQG